MSSSIAGAPAIRWNSTKSRGVTAAGHEVAVLRNRSSSLRMVQVKLPPGGTILELFRAALDDADAVAQAEDLVLWPTS